MYRFEFYLLIVLLCGRSVKSYLFSTIHPVYDDSQRICGKGDRPICCPGWHNGLNAPCSIASCAGNCGDRGECVRPNMCECSDGRFRFSCEKDETEKMQSDQATYFCPGNCNEHGKCVRGSCVCDVGYIGSRCEVASKASCFAKLQRGLCVNPIQYITVVGNITTELTQETCCNAFGVAWGVPCATCHMTYCGRGYRKEKSQCKDIDECQIAGVCRGGQCINTDGSYRCQCPRGYKFDEETLSCTVPKSTCELYGKQCLPGGRCIELRGNDFECICNWDHVASADRKSCTPRQKMAFNFCTLYDRNICKNGVCVPRENSYECICNQGFEPSVDRKSCRHKIDICAIHRGYLCKYGKCISLGRDFYCECDPGFTSSFDRRRCISPCEKMGPSICPNGQCIAHSDGDYECQCFAGYQGSSDNKQCLSNHVTPAPQTFNYPSPLRTYETPYAHTRSTDRMYYGTYQRDNAATTQAYRTSSQQPTVTMYSVGQIRRDTPPCSQPSVLANCAGGFCLNLGGSSYQCECASGYRTVNRGRQCIRSFARNW